MDSGTLVHIGDSYFGTNVMYVSVEPRDDSSFAVVVSSAATDAKELPAVLRTARDFWELHTALRSRILSHPLPHLPAKPEGLLGEALGGSMATPSGSRLEYAHKLQAYLVDLVSNEDLAVLPELAKFVGLPAGSTNAIATAATKAHAPPPAVDVDEATDTNGAGGGAGGESRVPPGGALALALSAEVAAPAGTGPPQTTVPRRATENNIIGAAALVRIGSAAAGGAPTAEGKPARSGKATKVTLSWSDEAGDHSVELPVLRPASELGNPVIDVRSLAAKTGFFTHDPGFTSTSSCESAISFIDGDKGLLLHRGYAIEDLAVHCSFPEVAFLLIEGELPARPELRAFEAEIKANWLVHERLLAFFGGFKSDAHPMAIMVGVVGALSAFYPDSVNIHDAAQRRLSAIRLIAKMPTIAAIAYKTSIGQPIVYPSNSLGFAANFLRMMFATPAEPYTVNPVHAAALETILILHADHEQNASTSTVRIASSSQANPFACIAAGIASLWGPAHGGANEAVLRMLGEIGSEENIPKFIERAKNKNDPFRLMGFGHRVYKNADPRAKLMQRICEQVFSGLNMASHPDLALARRLEAIALSDEYFVKRKLYPNVDFYSGIVLRALGIPTDMFTVLFAVARTSGWLAQWNESFSDPCQRISRPRQLYSGVPLRPFLPLEQRGNGPDPHAVADLPAANPADPGAAFAGGGVVVPTA